MGRKLLVVGYPKSGNTWLGYMLSYVLGARHIDLQNPDQQPWAKWICDLIGGGLSHSSNYDIVGKTHALPVNVENLSSYDRVICLARDPRDVIVSYYFFRYYNLPIMKGNPDAHARNRSRIFRWFHWMKTVRDVARAWPFHAVSWRAQGAFLVKYEDIHRDAASVLRTLCAHIEHEPDEGLLEKAVELFSFERMSGGRKAGQEDAYHFYRKGVVGDHKGRFGSVSRWILRRYAREQMDSLGYGP